MYLQDVESIEHDGDIEDYSEVESAENEPNNKVMYYQMVDDALRYYFLISMAIFEFLSLPSNSAFFRLTTSSVRQFRIQYFYKSRSETLSNLNTLNDGLSDRLPKGEPRKSIQK